MTAIYVGLGVVVVIILWWAWALTHAPTGYEDEAGFHFGSKK